VYVDPAGGGVGGSGGGGGRDSWSVVTDCFTSRGGAGEADL